MDAFVTIIAIIAIVINIAVIVKFLSLCKDVENIKNGIALYDKPHVELLTGDKEKIKQTITEMFMVKVQSVAATKLSQKAKDAYIKDYANNFDETAKRMGIDLNLSSKIDGLCQKAEDLLALR